MLLCEMLSHQFFSLHRLEVHIKSFSPYASDHSQNTHTHTYTEHNLILLYCPNPHLLSQGRRRKAFMQNRPSALIWIYTDKHSHICSHPHTHTHTHTDALSNCVPDEKVPIITADLIAITVCKFQTCLK